MRSRPRENPVRDFSVFNFDDRPKPVVIFHARREDCPVDFIFDDDTAVVRLVSNQLIGGLKLDVVAIETAPSNRDALG
jgi:hypothetical protein